MKRTLAVSFQAMVMIGLALSSMGARVQAQSRADEEAAVRAVILDGIAAFNRHDARAGTAFFTEDADFVTVYGKWSRGAAEIEKSRRERFETALKEARIKLLDLRVRFIRPDVALAHETHELSGMLGPEGEKMPTLRELSIRVLVKQRGKWLVTAFHNTVVRPADSAARNP